MTPLQNKTLVFVDAYIERRGFSPSFQEIQTGLGLASKSNVHRLVSRLVDLGYLRREGGPSSHRSLIPTHRATTTAVAQIPTFVLREELARRGEML